MVLSIGVLLVVGITRLVSGSGGGGTGGVTAANMGDRSSTTDPSATSSTGTAPQHHRADTQGHHKKKPKQAASDPTTAVAMPSGHCTASDVAITPSVPHPVGGRDVSVVLDISSLTTPACTWTLSPGTLAMKITSGSDLIWTTAQCSRSLPTHDLVLRQASPTQVKLTWNARRSEPGCPVQTEWARPGTYHLEIAALGGQPQEATFLLTAPSPGDNATSGTNHGHHEKKQKRHKKHHRPPG
jgi:hypothetical protein